MSGPSYLSDMLGHNERSIEMSGPTHLSQILSEFKGRVEKTSDKKTHYHVLLALVDGNIHDMEQTKRLLVDLSFMPASIIIVGVGEANFSTMQQLNA